MKSTGFISCKGKFRFFWLVLVLCLLLAAPALAQSFGVVYNTETLNLRAGASSSSSWLGSYSRGCWVEITGSQSNFYYVTTPDGRKGYMSMNYISVATEATAQIATVTNANGGSFLNFRSSPNYNSNVLGIFYAGVPLYVLNYQNGWYQVQINGQNGYVRSEYVSTASRVGSPTVATIKTPNNTSINLRSGPGTQHATIRQFPGDRYVMVLGKGNGWWRVSIDNAVGFMSSDFLVDGLRTAKDLGGGGGGGGGGSGGGSSYAIVSNPQSTQALNLRQSSSMASPVLSKLYNGTRLRVNAQGVDWCSVTVDNNTALSGYVMTKYIKLYNLPQSPTRRVTHPQGLYVNLRAEPSLSAGIRTQVSTGANVLVVSPGVEWTKVQYGGYTGYMLSYFLQ